MTISDQLLRTKKLKIKQWYINNTILFTLDDPKNG